MNAITSLFAALACGSAGRISSIERTLSDDCKKLWLKTILPYLSWNDLLRLRRVNRKFNQLTNDFIKANGEKLCPEVIIYDSFNPTEKSLEKFLDLGIPTSRIYIMNFTGNQMFEKERTSFGKFLCRYGSMIRHLRVHQMFNFPSGLEKSFYESLPNLESLVVDQFAGCLPAEQGIFLDCSIENPPQRFPATFKNLQRFAVILRPKFITMNVIQMSIKLMETCENLENCADAYSSFVNFGEAANDPDTIGIMFNMIKDYILKRAKKFPRKPNLKCYDFAALYDDTVCRNKGISFINAPKFSKMARVCVQHSIKLANVDALWFQNWLSRECFVQDYEPELFGDLVVSMVNLNALVVGLEMRNLESIVIHGTSRCCLMPSVWKCDRKPWASLKTLNITVDSKELDTMITSLHEKADEVVVVPAETTKSLMNLFFAGIVRPALVELRLKFELGVDVDTSTLTVASCIGSSCPNLKRLTLENWPGKDKSLAKIFEEAKFLEEVCLNKCTKIGNSAFTKPFKSKGKPLQKWKKVALLGLDKMPKITDTLFKDVLSQLPLNYLVLSSEEPLSNVTLEGILSLKSGIFATTIETFPFYNWSLSKQRFEDFQKLEKEFRSSQMF